MHYYIIRDDDGKPVTTGTEAGLRKWQSKRKAVLAADEQHCQWIQGDDGATYFDIWMTRPADEAIKTIGIRTNVSISEISEDEYEMAAFLGDEFEEDAVEDQQEPYAGDETEQDAEEISKPMTVNEMRKKIEKQSEQIEELQECILEMSIDLYGGNSDE